MITKILLILSTLSLLNSYNYTEQTDYLNRSLILQQYSSLKTINEHYLVQIQYQYQIYPSLNYQCNYDRQIQNYIANTDIWLCFNSNFVIIQCNQVWQVKINCGTFVQVHQPINSTILARRKIQSIQNPINLPINLLCSGIYHIWLIYSTRVGKVIKTVQPIFINYPFCQ